MFADLHAHYPMRVLTGVDPETTSRLIRSRRQPSLPDRARAAILRRSRASTGASVATTIMHDPSGLVSPWPPGVRGGAGANARCVYIPLNSPA